MVLLSLEIFLQVIIYIGEDRRGRRHLTSTLCEFSTAASDLAKAGLNRHAKSHADTFTRYRGYAPSVVTMCSSISSTTLMYREAAL